MKSPLDTARSLVIIRHPFFATILLNMKQVKTAEVAYMAVDGRNLYVNEAAVNVWPVPEIMGVLAHECMHVALMHHVRLREMAGSDMVDKGTAYLWNVATDFVINALLLKDNAIQLPSCGLTPNKFEALRAELGLPEVDLTKVSAEEVYRMLLQNSKVSEALGSIGADDGADIGGVMPAAGDSKVAEADAKMLVTQAAMNARANAGTMPGYLDELVDKVLAPKVNWRTQLRTFVSAIKTKDRTTFTRPNRRHTMSDVVFPSRDGRAMDKLNCVFDSSGSVSSLEFAQFLGELNGAVQSMQIKDVVCVVCDHAVQEVIKGTASQGQIRFNARGRGGTSMQPAFDELKNHRPAATIVFSDGEFYTGMEPPNSHPVLWCFTRKTSQPPAFGRTIYVEMDR